MKRFFRIILYTILTIFLLFGILFTIAEYAEEAVMKLTLREANYALGTDIEVKDVNLSLINDFPFTSIELIDVSVINPKHTEDTLIKSKTIALAVNPFSLMNNHLDVAYAKWKDANIYFHIDSLGKNNYDFLLTAQSVSSEDTSSTLPLLLDIKDVAFNNITFYIEADNMEAKSTIQFSELNVQAFIKENERKAALAGHIALYETNYSNTTLDRLEQLSIEIEAELINDSINLINGHIQSEGLVSTLNGSIKLDDHFNSHLFIRGTQLQLKELSKYIPDDINTTYNIENSEGTVQIEAEIKGALLDSILPQVNLDIALNNVSTTVLNYPPITSLNASFSYSNGPDGKLNDSKINIQNLDLKTAKSQLQVKGQVSNLDKPSFSIRSKANLDLEELSPLIPKENKIVMAGMVKIELESEGIVPDSINMAYIDQFLLNSNANLSFSEVDLSADTLVNINNLNGELGLSGKEFNINQLSLQLPEYTLKLKPSNLDGRFTGQLSDINNIAFQLDTFDIKVNNSQLSGDVYFKNSIKPNYAIHTNIHLSLDDWERYLPDSLVSNFSGNIHADINSKGSFHQDSIVDDILQILFKQSQLNLSTYNLNFATYDEQIRVDDFYGKLELNQDTIFIDKLTGAFNDTEFMADSTSITSLFESVILNQNKEVKVEGTFHLDEFDYATLESFLKKDTSTINSKTITDTTLTNYTFLIKGKASAHSLKYKNAIFYNVESLFRLSDSLYILDNLNFEAFNGKMNNSIKYKIEPNNQQEIWIKNNIQKMDIEQLLKEFDNFEEYGNTNITHEQLSGLFTTNLDGHFIMKDGEILYDAIELSGDMLLEEGRLKGYELAAEIGKENNIDNLDNLEFNTVKTKVFIYKNVIYIPRTNINNNALDVTIYGRQEFGDDCKYHLRFYLKELLKKGQAKNIERKKNKKDTEEHGGVKGASNVFVFYEIEEGKTIMWRESKKSKKAEQLRMVITMQEKGLKITFNPRAVSYDTGVSLKH